eukprot:scaffold5777_cov66-Attheya_sp.AAC.9
MAFYRRQGMGRNFGAFANIPIRLHANCACHSNNERNSIHAGVFFKHLQQTHFKTLNQQPPSHTVIVKANLAWTSTGNTIQEGCDNVDVLNGLPN